MSSVTLTPSQEAAYNGILDAISSPSGGAVLSAPAGSGKTFLTGLLIKTLLNRGKRVAATAPTHKAVAVLADKLPQGAEAMTVHSLLGLKMNEVDDGTHQIERTEKSRADQFYVVVVDECSMLSEELFNELTNRVEGFLLFVGDDSQLPPVKESVERSPVFDSQWLQQFRLTEIVRQKVGSSILDLATAIRQHKDDFFPVESVFEYADGEDVVIVPRDEILECWKPDSRILAWRNNVVQAYNQGVHKILHNHINAPFCRGDRVLLHTQHETFDEKTLHTSSEGTVMEAHMAVHPVWPKEAAWEVKILMDSGIMVNEFYPDDPKAHKSWINEAFGYSKQAKSEGDYRKARWWSDTGWSLRKSFIPLRLAYASTVHKAQGSTYHTAILDVSDFECMKSYNEFNKLFYTAVTRPSHQLILAIG